MYYERRWELSRRRLFMSFIFRPRMVPTVTSDAERYCLLWSCYEGMCQFIGSPLSSCYLIIVCHCIACHGIFNSLNHGLKTQVLSYSLSCWLRASVFQKQPVHVRRRIGYVVLLELNASSPSQSSRAARQDAHFNPSGLMLLHVYAQPLLYK